VELAQIRQVQIIADMLRSGSLPKATPAALAQPWLEYYTWIRRWIEEDPGSVNAQELRYDFTQQFYARSSEDADNYARIIAAMENPVRYPSAAEMLPGLPDMEWLWNGWIPRGMLVLLAATPGTGKSYFVLDLMRRIINSGEFPDGTQIERPGRVLYVDAENTPIVFKQRTQIWTSWELEQLHIMLPDPRRLCINLDDEVDRERLWDMAWVLRPDLVVVDSYGSASLRGENNKEDVQQMLAFLNQLAQDFGAGMIANHHLRKRTSSQSGFLRMTLDSVRGSSHLVAMARIVIAMQIIPTKPTEDLNGPRELWVMKSNLGLYPDSIGVYFAPHPACAEVAQLSYGEPPSPYQEPVKGNYCAEWLEGLLREAAEPLAPKEIIEIGKSEGYGRRMIYRTRRRLAEHIRDTESPRHPENKWEWVDL